MKEPNIPRIMDPLWPTHLEEQDSISFATVADSKFDLLN